MVHKSIYIVYNMFKESKRNDIYLIDAGGSAPFAVAGFAHGGRSFRWSGGPLVRVRTAVHVGSADV